jgi:hypothetical protein
MLYTPPSTVGDMIGVTAPDVRQIDVAVERWTRSITKAHRRLERATEIVYEYTRQRFDLEGMGEWPQLAEATVMRKISEGFANPERILYAEGNLYESMTSANGPYSFRVIDDTRAIIGVDWENGGWQIPLLLHEGSSDGRLPARPMWPTGVALEEMKRDIGHVLHGIAT